MMIKIKIVFKSCGCLFIELLFDGWIMIFYNFGVLVYLYREFWVVIWFRLYFLGMGSIWVGEVLVVILGL